MGELGVYRTTGVKPNFGDMVFEEKVEPHPLQSQRWEPSLFLPFLTNLGQPQRGHASGAPGPVAPSSRATASRAACSTAPFSSKVSDPSWSSTSLSIPNPPPSRLTGHPTGRSGQLMSTVV